MVLSSHPNLAKVREGFWERRLVVVTGHLERG